MRIIFVALCVLCVSGCTVLRTIEPDALPIEVTHVSHLTQHFGSEPTNYGYNAVSLGARWKVGPVNVTLSEGYVLDSRQTWTFADTGRQQELHSGLIGPREVFTGRITYEVPLK
jgi:hypothetical protein